MATIYAEIGTLEIFEVDFQQGPLFTTPWGVASLDPRGLIGRIYVGDY